MLGAQSLNMAHCHRFESSMVHLASAPDLRVAVSCARNSGLKCLPGAGPLHAVTSEHVKLD